MKKSNHVLSSICIMAFFLYPFLLNSQESGTLDRSANSHLSIYLNGNLWSQSSIQIKDVMRTYQYNVPVTSSFFGTNTRHHPRTSSSVGISLDFDTQLKNQLFVGGMFGLSNTLSTEGHHRQNGNLDVDQQNIFIAPILRFYTNDGRTCIHVGPSLNLMRYQEYTYFSNADFSFEEDFFQPGFLIGGQLHFFSGKRLFSGVQAQYHYAGKTEIGPFHNRLEEITIPMISVGSSHFTVGITLGYKFY